MVVRVLLVVEVPHMLDVEGEEHVEDIENNYYIPVAIVGKIEGRKIAWLFLIGKLV